MTEPRQIEEPKEGGSAQSMGLPTSGGDERSFRPHPPLLTPVWQGLPCHSLPASKGPFSSRPKVLPEPARTLPAVRVCLQPLAVCLCVCSRHRVQAFQAALVRVPQNRVVEGLDLPLLTAGPVEAARPILPAWGAGDVHPMPVSRGWSARPLWPRTGHGGA